MKIKQLKAHIIASAILGVIILGLAIALVNQHVAIARASARIDEQREALSMLSKDAWSRQSMTGSFNKLSSILGGRYRVVSWSDQMPFMMNQLTGIMEAHKLKIDTLRPEPITSSGKVYRLPLRVSFKASLGDLAHAVRDIEKTIPVLSIEQLGVRSAGVKSDVLQADMVVSLFAVADPSAPMPEDLKLRHGKDNPVTVTVQASTHSEIVGKSKVKSQKSGRDLASQPFSSIAKKPNASGTTPRSVSDVGRNNRFGRRHVFSVDSSGQPPLGANGPKPAATFRSQGGLQ